MIRLYDTMERRKKDFVPPDPARITMYVCGPTVYGRAHIGNARPAVVFDTLARLIRHVHPERELVYARNVTDVDDKIIAAAQAEGVEPSVITERYEQHYLTDMAALGVAPPTIAPHATAEIGPMVAMIGELIAKGHAYAAEGHVLFSVASDPDYGALSRRDRDAMVAGARVEVAPYKRDAADFVLWKPSAAGVIGWDSPWGRGRPGWHIECSAMIRAHLGETIDIHGGGQDLIFPHHENELAQSRCAHGGAPLARHWVHNGFVDMGAEKMSKSLGNVVGVDELLKAGHKGETLRLALLSAHYRSPLPWTASLVQAKDGQLWRWYRAKKILRNRGVATPSLEFLDALSDDLNTPEAIKTIDKLADRALKFKADYEVTRSRSDLVQAGRAARSMLACADLLGLLRESSRAYHTGVGLKLHGRTREFNISGPNVDLIVRRRTEAKAARDFVSADRIRDELKAEGILVEDGPTGTTWRRA